MTEDILTVRTEATPNPNSLKYHIGKLLIPGGSANFPTPESAAERSPLASRLFDVEGVLGVFIGADFFTITRDENYEWSTLNEGLAPALEAFLESGDTVLTGKAAATKPSVGDVNADPAIVEKIQGLLDEKVRPAVAQDGGDIIYRGYDNGVVYLEMYGACSGCPSSTVTLKQGVETMLQQHIPEIVAIEAV